MPRACFQALLLLLVVYFVSLENPGHIASSITRRSAAPDAPGSLYRKSLWVGRAASPTTCGFLGNSDIYGLGI
jgi:hypothetical protein